MDPVEVYGAACADGGVVSEALEQLCCDLVITGRPSLAWAVEHAPDGDLNAAVARLWSACDDERWMLDLWILTTGAGGQVPASPDLDAALTAHHRGSEPHHIGSRCCAEIVRAHCPVPSLVAWLAARETSHA